MITLVTEFCNRAAARRGVVDARAERIYAANYTSAQALFPGMTTLPLP
jgi:sulfur relay (sulfurtransferase) complex TusBCD TusD component (DsrE family)